MFLILFAICGLEFSSSQFSVDLKESPEFLLGDLCFEGLLVASEVKSSLFARQLEEMEEETISNENEEKTPMAIVNEITRYNKIENKYTLIDETGPAHSKVFKIKLDLGVETYHGVEKSIRKAQQNAAAMAVQKTSYSTPPKKNIRSDESMPPTVVLNTMTMKLGIQPIYSVMNYGRSNIYSSERSYDLYMNSNQCLAACSSFNGFKTYQIPCEETTVKLEINDKEYIGRGYNIENAKNKAATAAIAGLENENALEQKSFTKSPISLLREKASKLGLQVTFNVINEYGPHHLRTFETKCAVGEDFAVGSAVGKHASKIDAATKILEKINSSESWSLTNPTTSHNIKKKKKSKKPVEKKISGNSNLEDQITMDESVVRTDIDSTIELENVARFLHGPSVYPIYTTRNLKQNGRLFYETTVNVNGREFKTTSTSMRESKRLAAIGMLEELGYRSRLPERHNRNINMKQTIPNLNRPKLTGEQLAPGLTLVPNSQLPGGDTSNQLNYTLNGQEEQHFENIEKIVDGAKYLKQVADLFGIRVQYVILPGSFERNYVVKLQLVFPENLPVTSGKHRVCSGAGPTIESSRDKAATRGLKLLWISRFIDITCSNVDDWNNVQAKITIVPDMISKGVILK